ncbi:MAG TPA: MFS transporter [Desulfobacteraceae bacterium]|nr:MFS transporter [Desulfobacteraceae bacterium]
MDKNILRLELAVCALVTAAFTNIYITQPILPVLETEFQVTTVHVSFTVSFVILGIVISNLFFGYLSDRIAIHPILLAGGCMVAAGGVVCSLTHDVNVLIGARFVQGLFIPALTTSLAAWLAKNLPQEKLSVVMGTYVAATVLGGLGGRLLGGWIHPPLHWRYAFWSAAVLIVVTTLVAVAVLPQSNNESKQESDRAGAASSDMGFVRLLTRPDLFPIYLCGAAGLLMFSPIFNYLPYRLSGAPFGFSTQMITLVYLVYILGIFLGPVSGKISQRFGGGNTMILGCAVLAISLGLLLVPAVWAVIAGLLSLCAGFFTIHATAVGLLNRKLSHSQGRANALYVLFYYAGGWIGITLAGFCLEAWGWPGVVIGVAAFLFVPLITGLRERRR